MLVGGHRRYVVLCCVYVFFQAEDGIRDRVRSRGLGNVYKRQAVPTDIPAPEVAPTDAPAPADTAGERPRLLLATCLLYTSVAADEPSSVDSGGGRIINTHIKNKTQQSTSQSQHLGYNTRRN